MTTSQIDNLSRTEFIDEVSIVSSGIPTELGPIGGNVKQTRKRCWTVAVEGSVNLPFPSTWRKASGFAEPYAVHEERRLVFVQRIQVIADE
jgi:hypothetical protein